MKQKSEVFEVFKKWKAMVENETDLKVKRLRFDNGGKYELGEFKKFCGLNGIHLESTPSGTPQLNVIAERMNMTLTERARSMRIHAGLPKMFWADAMCTFIGYGGDEFGYRFWDDKNRKVCTFIGLPNSGIESLMASCYAVATQGAMEITVVSSRVSTPLESYFKLSQGQSPKTDVEREYMAKVPYTSAIGSLMYAMVNTRPDIAHAVGVVSRFASNPGKHHWKAVKWIMRYLRGTTDLSLCFGRGKLTVKRYVDADFADDQDMRRNTIGYVYTMSSTAVSWVSRLQKLVTLSTKESEYVAVTEAAKKKIWMKSFLQELGLKEEN
ncbi:hypothetical protein AXG93_1923s1620 [Marchantia polymorpha subsp. ruderalis]|uniref:Integrase catalytic domain-containing protein n=1 Tax=Marchantia polymorpha subsp. ruderalis TaxID=1480154 RepID=A0A176VFA0_MARPO|nr:hypothetical protein AXG93_1923s1620 [Marchantia polymorpha subsp. ruderalis]